MIEIRNAVAADAPELASLIGVLEYSVAAAELPGRLERFVSQGNGQVLVAVSEGNVIGFAAVEITYPIYQPYPVAHLSAFAIAQNWQRQGVGQKLLAAVEAAARSSGCGRVVVTSAERRAAAHAFYLAAGWAYTGRRFGKKLD